MRTRGEEGERFQPGRRSNGRPQTGPHVACGDAGQGLTELLGFPSQNIGENQCVERKVLVWLVESKLPACDWPVTMLWTCGRCFMGSQALESGEGLRSHNFFRDRVSL